MKITLFKQLLFICFFLSIPSFMVSQEKESTYTIEDVLNLESSYYDNLKEGEKHTWTANDGYTYGIKKTDNSKVTYIKFDGDFVKHGTYYRYGETYGASSFEYLQEKTDYVYGVKHGVSEWYYAENGKVYLSEVTHFNYGLRHGEYIEYFSNGDIKEKGEYNNGIKSGVWTQYYDNRAVMYEYKYDKFDAICEAYDYPIEQDKKGKKGKLTSIVPYQYYIENGRGRWVKHGVANFVTYDGKNVEKFYYLNKEVDSWQDNPDSKTEYYNSTQACAKGAEEIHALLKTMKTTSKREKLIQTLGKEVCVYLVEYTPEEETWYPTIKSLRMKIQELTKRKATDKDVKIVLDFRTSVTMGIRN